VQDDYWCRALSNLLYCLARLLANPCFRPDTMSYNTTACVLTAIILFVLSCFSLILRIYVRFFLLRNFAIDDYIAIIAAVSHWFLVLKCDLVTDRPGYEFRAFNQLLDRSLAFRPWKRHPQRGLAAWAKAHLAWITLLFPHNAPRQTVIHLHPLSHRD
jgi:hypothetical protein